MKIFSCIVLLVAVAVASGDKKPSYNMRDAPQLFEKFVKDYHRHYKSTADMIEHYSAFLKYLYHINGINLGSNGDTIDINEFSDYTPSELANYKGSRKIP